MIPRRYFISFDLKFTCCFRPVLDRTSCMHTFGTFKRATTPWGGTPCVYFAAAAASAAATSASAIAVCTAIKSSA